MSCRLLTARGILQLFSYLTVKQHLALLSSPFWNTSFLCLHDSLLSRAFLLFNLSMVFVGLSSTWPWRSHNTRGSALSTLFFSLCSTARPSPPASSHPWSWLHSAPLIYICQWFSMSIFWLILLFIHWILTYNYLLEISTWTSEGYLKHNKSKVKFLIFNPVQTCLSPRTQYWWMAPPHYLISYHTSPYSLALDYIGLLFIFQIDHAVIPKNHVALFLSFKTFVVVVCFKVLIF